ncbi:hypothetical protein FBQ82_19250 [Anaerolineae bacterium CFX7]|nr:hypothetical protein [Anaerolineae bacterium CFX7]
MNFLRSRKTVSSRTPNLYLRDTWGQAYGLAHTRRFDRRSFFLRAMAILGAIDLIMALGFGWAWLFPPRPPVAAAKRAAPTRLAVQARTSTPEPTATEQPTDLPTPTRQRSRTRAPTFAPTQAAPPPPTAAPIVEKKVAPARTLAYALPATLNVGALTINVPPEPQNCTPPEQMPDVVSASVKLCADAEYRPFTVRGENIGVFGNANAVIRAQGRGFAIVAEGARILIANVVIRATTAAEDGAILLCLYPDCRGQAGGVAYGGGILVRAADTTVMDSDIAGGVAGIAAERVRGLKALNNRLDNATGWGSYNFAVTDSVFAGNSFSYANRSCTTPDGSYLASGCEAAGWLCIACQKNIVARNACTGSGDCFYMNGEGNLTSNDNRFHQNECRAAPHNCYEVTFATGNEFVENIARDDPATGVACKYPFWVGGSHVYFARNQWSCTISPEVALADAAASTGVPTRIENR